MRAVIIEQIIKIEGLPTGAWAVFLGELAGTFYLIFSTMSKEEWCEQAHNENARLVLSIAVGDINQEMKIHDASVSACEYEKVGGEDKLCFLEVESADKQHNITVDTWSFIATINGEEISLDEHGVDTFDNFSN